jgi:hypothetical protein
MDVIFPVDTILLSLVESVFLREGVDRTVSDRL